MARPWSIHRGCNALHQELTARLFHCHTAWGGVVEESPKLETRISKFGLVRQVGFRIFFQICLLAASFPWTTAHAASTGPGIAFKIGAQTLEDPINLEKTTRARLELEISSPVFADDHLDLAFTVGGSSLGSVQDDYADVVDGTLIEESFDDDLLMLDIRLAARLYPFGYDRTVRPYVGAGVGYFWFFDDWEYRYAETFEDPLFPGTFHTTIHEEEGTDTLAHGLFPFFLAGLSVSVSDNAELLFELQYDIDKEDAGIDLSGPIYMFGGRIRF